MRVFVGFEMMAGVELNRRHKDFDSGRFEKAACALYRTPDNKIGENPI